MRNWPRRTCKVERIEVPRADAIETFERMGEHYKVEILDGIPEGEQVSIYKQGDWMDLCRGPHVPSTRYIRAFKLTGVAGAYWRGDEHNAMLSRIYGTSFATKEALEEHLKMLELARSETIASSGARWDCRLRSDLAGSPFFLPKGAIDLQRPGRLHRRLYRRYGFDEVITPQVFKNEMWHTSGHWDNFRENMFLTPDHEGGADNEDVLDTSPEGWHTGYAFKPMNCPGQLSCTAPRSDRIGIYRCASRTSADSIAAERSGVLHGLTVFARWPRMTRTSSAPQIRSRRKSISTCAMVNDVYTTFGFELA